MEEKFPKNFLWGASISSYQTEGNNINSNWWRWEEKGKTNGRSGKACNYWEDYKIYHDYLSELGVNAFRLSLEWSRIEPEEGKFSDEAIEHYRDILGDLKKRNIKVILTLWHWTVPIWFEDKYGFHRKKSVDIFTRYAEYAYRGLKDLIDIVVVLNEPMIFLGLGYLLGGHPPGSRSPFKFVKALNNLARAYIKTYQAIKAIRSDVPVGITYWYNWFTTDIIFSRLILKISRWFRIDWFGKKIKKHQDYFGLDYYRISKIKFGLKNSVFMGLGIENDPANVMGWTAYPEGIYRVVHEIKNNYGELPIYIMENGKPTGEGVEDNERAEFIQNHLDYVKKAMAEGIDVRGYCHWSLIDNFEWSHGFHPHFGLIEVNFDTLAKKPKKSYYKYKEIIERKSF
jgi:beta-glucosidase